MRAIAIALIVSFMTAGNVLSAEAATAAKADQELAAWRKVAEAIPLGSKVKVQLVDGKTVKGTLMRVDDKTVMVKRSTRRPEPGVVVPFDMMSMIERDHGGGFGLGKALAVAGVTAGVAVLTLFVIALSLD